MKLWGLKFDQRFGKTFFLLAVLLILWQLANIPNTHNLNRAYQISASTGLQDGTDKFAYFYYHTGLFPLYTTQKEVVDSRAGAEDLIKTKGGSLFMEFRHVVRAGDLGRVWTYFPKIFLTGGSTKNLSVIPTHIIFFILSLLSVLAGFWRTRFWLIGIFLVLFFGSNSFQVYETFANENIFSWPITTALFLLGLHASMFESQTSALFASKSFFKKHSHWVIPILTGILLGTVRQIRAEPATMLLGAAFIYLTLANEKWLKRLGFTAALLLSFFLTQKHWQNHFEKNFEKTAQVVEKAGGDVYTGPRFIYHSHWHPIFCGLGDFDRKYGYEWNDPVAYKYARPILKAKYGLDLAELDGCCSSKEFYDKQKQYYKRPYEVPEYDLVIKDKILTDIKNDPSWYADILWKRIKATFTQPPLPQLALRGHIINSHLRPIVFLFFLIYLIWRRNWPMVKLIMFTMPLSLTAILIFSGGGTAYYTVWHLVAAAVAAASLTQTLLPRALNKIKSSRIPKA